AVDVNRTRDCNAAHVDGLRCREAIGSIETQTETAHHLAVEARRWVGLHEYAYGAEAIDRCAECRSLSWPNLRRAYAAGIHARRRSVLYAPVRAAGISDVVESGSRTGQTQKRDGNKKKYNAAASARCHGRNRRLGHQSSDPALQRFRRLRAQALAD